MIAIIIGVSILLGLLGYIYTCCYLNETKWTFTNRSVLKITRNKILFLSAEIIAMGILLLMFQTIYHLQMISQIKLISLISILFPIAAIDFRLQKIPNKLLLIALIVRGLIFLIECILSLSNAMTVLKDSLLGAFVIAAFFLLILLIFKNSIGMGDIKLFAMMGLYQGFLGAATSVFFSLLISSVISAFLLITRKKKSRKDTIPLGPSVLLGTIFAMGLTGI